jgi:hypothetical protein
MARHVVRTTITADGRDKGKVFELREMDAPDGEKWAMRCLNAAMQSGGIDLGDVAPVASIAGTPGLGLVAVSAIARMPWSLAEPLVDQMMACVRPVSPDGTLVRERLMPEDTEEIATRLTLREEVASLHLGFSLAEAARGWLQGILARIAQASPDAPPAPASASNGA